MKKDPTFSQITYMVTGLMSSFVQKNGTIDEKTVRSCVDLAKVAYDYISELYPAEEMEISEKKEEIEIVNPFKDCYLLTNNKCAKYTEISNWLKNELNIKSNRRIAELMKRFLHRGSDRLYRLQDDLTAQRPTSTP